MKTMMEEWKRDARTLNDQTKYELRKQVIRLKEKGLKGREISELVGLGVVQISRIWQKYLKGGSAAIKPKGADVLLGDETGVQTDVNRERGFAPRGTPPVLHVDVKKTKVNMLSAITNDGKVRFMLYPKTMTLQVLIRFMGKVVRAAERKVFLILDNLKVHHSQPVKKWLSTHQEQIEVFYLPLILRS
jgi:hypothetical protein